MEKLMTQQFIFLLKLSEQEIRNMMFFSHFQKGRCQQIFLQREKLFISVHLPGIISCLCIIMLSDYFQGACEFFSMAFLSLKFPVLSFLFSLLLHNKLYPISPQNLEDSASFQYLGTNMNVITCISVCELQSYSDDSSNY